MLDLALLFKLLALLAIANGAPILATTVFMARLARAVDGGIKLADGQRLFGASKTIRGITASVFCTALAAPLLSLDWKVGALLATASMIGDLGSSFLKRRLALQVHTQAFALDHIPEALLPLLLLQWWIGLGWVEIAIILVVFTSCGALLSRLLPIQTRERLSRIGRP